MSVILDNMNPYVIRDELLKHKGERVLIKVYGMRNKNDNFIGILQEIYPQIFIVNTQGQTKSFSYAEIINGEIEISFV